MDLLYLLWDRLGLILNFAGSIMIAFSFGRNLGEAHQIRKGRKIYLASFLHPWIFRVGCFLLAGGFLFDMFAD